MTDNIRKKKILWLALNLSMVVSMIIIGGITRLTDSGLSMTNWNLIKGILPPLTEADWMQLFQLYKQYPEYQLKNITMSIFEFKKIFFWEYLHRVWGRLVGLTFLLPLLFFLIKGWFSKSEKKLLLILSLLGFFQAFMGWYMVKSGLIDKPDVSHFRLSIHLSTAFVIYSILLYYFWNLFSKNKNEETKLSYKRLMLHKSNFIISLFLLFTTIIAGALVSGTNAGLAYNNFPLMGDGFFPPIFYEIESLYLNTLFNDQGFLQFTHRLLATATLLFVLHTIFKANKDGLFNNIKVIFYSLSSLIVIQYTLGIIILRLYVPIFLGLLHQLGAVIIISLIIISLCEINKKKTGFNKTPFN